MSPNNGKTTLSETEDPTDETSSKVDVCGGQACGGGYAAGYYSYKWAEIMSCDAYGAFEEAEPGEYARLGAKFRSTVLALGGSKSAYDVFRLFRGRTPSIEPMLRQQGLVAATE